MAVMAVPINMTFTLPDWSAILPLKKREKNAFSVNTPTIKPTYSSPPIALKNPGNSGRSMEKLLMNNTVLEQRIQKGRVNMV